MCVRETNKQPQRKRGVMGFFWRRCSGGTQTDTFFEVEEEESDSSIQFIRLEGFETYATKYLS